MFWCGAAFGGCLSYTASIPHARVARALKPKVVLWAMSKMNGLLATTRILEAQPEIAMLISSMHSEATLLRRAIEAGVCGFILKNAVELDLASAITRVAAGEFVLAPQTLRADRARGRPQQRIESTGTGGAAIDR